MALFPIISGFYACILLAVTLMFRNKNLPNIFGFIATFIITVLTGYLIGQFILPGLIACLVSTLDFSYLDFSNLDLSLFGYIALPAGVGIGIGRINNNSPLFMDNSNQGSSSTGNSNYSQPTTTSAIKNLSKPDLLTLLQSNQAKITNNISTADSTCQEAERLISRAQAYFSRYKDKLSEQSLETIYAALAPNAGRRFLPSGATQVDKALFNIEKQQSRIADAKFKTRSVAQSIPSNTRTVSTTNKILGESDLIFNRLNTLASDISTGVSENSAITRELNNR